MAAGLISKPGTEYGPCEGSCTHSDCKSLRKIAQSECYICGQTIGYDKRFYEDASGFTHAICTEKQIEEEQNSRQK